jgi:hypothetical protein
MELKELEARYKNVISYVKSMRDDLHNKLQTEFGEDSWAKEQAKSEKYHADVENIQRCIEYSKKLYDTIESMKSKTEGIDKDKTKMQIAIRIELFKNTRKNNVSYRNNAVLHKNYKLTDKRFNNTPKIITESMTNPVGMLYNFSKSHMEKVVMVNPLSISRGGSVEHGQQGVEENICLQTNYWKVLGKFVENDVYQVNNIGDMVYSPKVTRLRDSNLKWLSDDQRSHANMIGVKFPYRLDSLMIKNKALYDKDSDRKLIAEILDKTFSLCVDNGHEIVIFNNIGTGSISYPEDEFIDIIREKINKYKFKMFVFCGYSGDIDGADKHDRYKWIKYCKLLDNTTDYSKRKDVEEPLEIKPILDENNSKSQEVDSGSEPDE